MVAVAVAVFILLVAVGVIWAIVIYIEDPIQIKVLTGVAHSICVYISLIWICQNGAVVICINDAVFVFIRGTLIAIYYGKWRIKNNYVGGDV